MRIYHPDSPVSRPLPAAAAQARFQGITAAYDALRGKAHAAAGVAAARNDLHNVSSALWRAKQRRRAELGGGGLDERWKDRLLLGAVVLVSPAGATQCIARHPR